MIRTSTVLVPGAGASVNVGYPLGQGLLNDLCLHKRSDRFDFPNPWTAADADRIVTRLSRSGRS